MQIEPPSKTKHSRRLNARPNLRVDLDPGFVRQGNVNGLYHRGRILSVG